MSDYRELMSWLLECGLLSFSLSNLGMLLAKKLAGKQYEYPGCLMGMLASWFVIFAISLFYVWLAVMD